MADWYGQRGAVLCAEHLERAEAAEAARAFGEAAQGPTSAAVGNAIRNAIGKRLYDLPLTRQRVKAAMGV